MVAVICRKDRFLVGTERQMELWMMKENSGNDGSRKRGGMRLMQ